MAEMKSQSFDSDESIDNETLAFVDHIWAAAQGNLETFLSVPVESIKLADVDNAESIMLSIKNMIQKGSLDGSESSKLTSDFYKLIPHKPGASNRPTLDNMSVVSRKLDLCQVSGGSISFFQHN